MAEKRWSAMSPQELLDKAQQQFEREGSAGNHMTVGKTNAALLIQAAQVQAIENLSWTLENRIAPTIADAAAR